MRDEIISTVTAHSSNQSVEFRLSVWQDESPENPRNWDNRCAFKFRKHRRYSLPEEFDVDLDDEKSVLRWGEEYWMWPLSSYEHGNISFSLGRATCRWDGADNVGLVLVPKIFESKKVTEEQAYGWAEAELETFNDWMNGSVYGFSVERLATFTKTYADGSESQGEEWLDVETCGGYYGYDHEKSCLLKSANAALKHYCVSEMAMLPHEVPAFKE